jgi:hypothetical protein
MIGIVEMMNNSISKSFLAFGLLAASMPELGNGFSARKRFTSIERETKKCLNCGKEHNHNNSFCCANCCKEWRNKNKP